VRVDFVNPKVTVLEIPRDLWVEIPDIADDLDGQDHEKLNQAYLYGNPGFGYTDDPAQGPGMLARTLTLHFNADRSYHRGQHADVRKDRQCGGIESITCRNCRWMARLAIQTSACFSRHII
jgi:hypothetical protein